jgi:hypothetical protein
MKGGQAICGNACVSSTQGELVFEWFHDLNIILSANDKSTSIVFRLA